MQGFRTWSSRQFSAKVHEVHCAPIEHTLRNVWLSTAFARPKSAIFGNFGTVSVSNIFYGRRVSKYWNLGCGNIFELTSGFRSR